jgi:hypothetical protein
MFILIPIYTYYDGETDEIPGWPEFYNPLSHIPTDSVS